MLAKLEWSPFVELLQFIEAQTGLAFTTDRHQAVQETLNEIVKLSGTEDLPTYLEGLRSGRIDIDPLVNALTVRETYFFRHSEQIKYVGKEILPELARLRDSSQSLRIWSAGCSSGEEPYTLAMLAEQLGLLDRIQILATDICRIALNDAQNASYMEWSFRGTDPSFRKTYFEKSGKRYRVLPHIRKPVNFNYFNLVKDNYPSMLSQIWKMDLILCRNVLIYFNTETIAKIAGRLYESLSNEGWLITAVTDPPLKDYAPFEVVNTPLGVAYRRFDRVGEVSLPQPRTIIKLNKSSKQTPTPIAKSTPPIHERPESIEAAEEALVQGNYEQVITLTHHRLQEERAQTLYVEALANLKGGEQGVEATLKALERHPFSTKLFFIGCALLMSLQRWEEALAITNKLLYLEGNNAMAHFNKGSILRQLKETSGALKSFKNAQKLAQQLPKDSPLPLTRGEYAGRLVQLCDEQIALLTKNNESKI